MTTKEKIEIMKAYDEGKLIQMRLLNGASSDGSGWVDCKKEPDWNWEACEYRIRPHDKFTAEWFTEEMQRLAENNDIEDRHCEMDNLMCELLEHLGYSEGVKIYNDTEMWYA